MKITSYACTALAFTFLATSAHAGCNQKTDMEICVTTDDYPEETKCIVDDGSGSQRIEMNNMSKAGKTYCDDVRLCPGWHSLTLKDSYGDGFDGRVTVRPVGSGKIIDERPRNFSYTGGVRLFRYRSAPTPMVATTTTTTTQHSRKQRTLRFAQLPRVQGRVRAEKQWRFVGQETVQDRPLPCAFRQEALQGLV